MIFFCENLGWQSSIHYLLLSLSTPITIYYSHLAHVLHARILLPAPSTRLCTTCTLSTWHMYSRHSHYLLPSLGTCVPIAGQIQRCHPTGMKWLTSHTSKEKKMENPRAGISEDVTPGRLLLHDQRLSKQSQGCGEPL